MSAPSPLPAARPIEEVLTDAVLRAATEISWPKARLARTLGVSPASLSRLGRSRSIDPETKEGELAILFLRAFRALDALLGGDAARCRAWLSSDNHHLGGVPNELMESVEGLVRVGQYLDAMRGKV